MNPEREFVFEETGKLGINITAKLKSPPRSVYVSNVNAGSLAERKGLRVGDEITIVEPHGEDGPRPNESIEIWEDRYKTDSGGYQTSPLYLLSTCLSGKDPCVKDEQCADKGGQHVWCWGLFIV